MINSKDILADMHTHTLFSGHAFSTIKENKDEAALCGLKYIVISDHYYNDGTLINKKNETNRLRYMEKNVNRRNEEVYAICTAEFNLNQEIFEKEKLNLNWRPIGVHSWFVDLKETTLTDLYNLYVNAAKEGFNCFVHIERELQKLNHKKDALNIYGTLSPLSSNIKLWLESICILAKEFNIYLELNETSIILNEDGGLERIKYWLKFAKENGNLLSLGSDAHYCKDVGKFDNAIKLLNEVNYPKELIINCNEELLEKLKTT